MSKVLTRLREAALPSRVPMFVWNQAVALISRVEKRLAYRANSMFRLLVLGGMAACVSPALAQNESIAPASTLHHNNSVWSLPSATQRILEIAPERRLFDAAVDARLEALKQAGEWPNPGMELRADDRIGQMSGGGINFAQSSLSQPLPIRRIERQQAVAELNLAATQSARNAQLLLLEREAARVFHALQLAAAKLQLAREQMALTDQFSSGKMAVSGDHLKRYLTPIELQRLAVMREVGRQLVVTAQLDHKHAQIEFRNLLGLADSPAAEIETTPLTQPLPMPTLDDIERDLDRHPAIRAASLEAEAARKGVEVAESQRYADPVLKLFRDREFNNGAVFNVTGIGVSFEIPVWNRNRALVGKAIAEAETSSGRYEALRRDARTSLEQAFDEFAQLRNEIQQIHAKLVEPAQSILELARRSFAAGESSVLALVDANSTNFDARSRYLDLLNRYALAAADLRVAAGLSVLQQKEFQP